MSGRLQQCHTPTFVKKRPGREKDQSRGSRGGDGRRIVLKFKSLIGMTPLKGKRKP